MPSCLKLRPLEYFLLEDVMQKSFRSAMEDKSASASRNQHKEEIRNAIRDGASLTPTYIVMNMLATIIACYGLLVDSAAGIIGAMVVALLLGPIAGAGLALVENDLLLLKKSLLAEVVGVAIVMTTAFVIGILHREIPIGKEILARTSPGSPDLMIALAGGAAATVASISPSVSLSLVGVAIATALVPPLSTCSILLARGATELSFGAFLLAFTNMVAIQFSSSVIFWIAGYSHTKRFWSVGYRVFLRNLVSIILLVVLGVILAVSTYRTVTNMIFEADVRKTLQGFLKEYPGTNLSEVRFDKADGKTLVRAVIRSPGAFSAQDVVAMKRQLPVDPNGSEISLRVRRVAVEVMGEKGPMFETEAAFGEDIGHLSK
jgi:uncharacterized hydrophobic protein (TIGR00271 family)